ncbi:MAG: cell division protein SepF [Clostridia bacterium]|nr:cell division protein SepF [Clostridia bacterium]
MSERHSIEDYPFFEDTHNEPYSRKSTVREEPMLPPTSADKIVPRDYQNVLVYEPKTLNDVQTLIDYLKRKEPAIINLDGADAVAAQRTLDFTAGAMYALNGSILRIAGNIFLLSPEGVGVTIPHEISNK